MVFFCDQIISFDSELKGFADSITQLGLEIVNNFFVFT